MDIFLIDGIGPFFRHYKKHQINWSKIPFHYIDKKINAGIDPFPRIAADLEIFAGKVSQAGYNSISFDDVAHLTTGRWMEPEIRKLVSVYQHEYRKLFAICKKHELDIYITMDILSLTPAIKNEIGCNYNLARQFLVRQIKSVLTDFSEIQGIILRIGECDGKDVKGHFVSELLLKTPKQVNRILHDLLPLFEQKNRYLILRNWTVGAYKIGDLIWHRRTMSRVLHGIDSPNFILSLKYGESDFFRYLPLNKHFFRLKVKKIIELQARREYEGCGEYPSFIGWDYKQYAEQLESAENMAGISVWCQTGGWVPFRRLTYLQPEGIWNELNTFLCIKIFKDRLPVEDAVKEFAESIGCDASDLFLEFLKLNDEVIKELLYIEEIAGLKLFFRRVRIPPLLSVMWNSIFINDSVRKILNVLIGSGQECIQKGYLALEKLEQMEKIAEELKLPVDDVRYMYDTFNLLALAREYYFNPYSDTIRKNIQNHKKKYKKKYPKGSRPRYRIKTNFRPFLLKRRHLRWILRISLRKKRGYRIFDYLITLHILAIFYRLLIMIRPKLIPKFARKRAMGIETIFK